MRKAVASCIQTVVYAALAVAIGSIAAPSCGACLPRHPILHLPPSTAATTTLSAGNIRGIVREVLGELLPTSSGHSSGSVGMPLRGMPLRGAGAGEWYTKKEAYS